MPQFSDRVKTTSTSTGSSAITLSSSGQTGYQAFPSSLDGETVGYVIESGSAWEIGTGVYTHSSLNLTRSLRSSSTGSLLNLGSGTHTVFLTPAAQDIQIVEAFSGTSDLPSASDNHGRIYHVHGEGAMYFAHSGSWVKLANYSDISTYTHPNHSGEVTSTGDGATVISDNVVDEANLKVSNSPTDGYVLTARSGNTGGMTWESASGGGGGISNVVEDTTPQLGGDLDTNSKSIKFGDRSGSGVNELVFGDGDDLRIFHGTNNHSQIVEGGSGNLQVYASNLQLKTNAGADFLLATDGGSVELFHNSNKKFETTSSGIQTTGTLNVNNAYTLPTSDGSASQVLQTDGSGTISFATVSGGGGGGGGSTTVYNGINGTDGTPSGYTYLVNASSPSDGDLAFVTANNTVYVRASSGWRKIATVQEAPSAVTGHSASYPSIGQNATTDITLSSTDPEGFDVTWSYVVGGNGTLSGSNINNSNGDTLASIAIQTANSNSGGTNTITFRITRETTSIAGDFTITFTATDSQSTGTSDTGAISFTLEFIISNSHYTTLLMSADGSAGDNNDDITDAAGNHTSNITVSDNPSAGTFSPYRHGGYSTYFDGNDYLAVTKSTDLDLDTNNFTIECWLNLTNPSAAQAIYSFGYEAQTTRGCIIYLLNGNLHFAYSTTGSNNTDTSMGSHGITANEWTHLSVVRNGSTITGYIDGSALGTTINIGSSDIYYPSSGNVRIGGDGTNFVTGYISDFRLVNGSAITPASGGPTERLTDVSGSGYSTALLTCHLPYFADGSSSGSSSPHSITISGDPETKPFGPYDYEAYSASTNGGSIEFDGSNDAVEIADHGDFDLSGGNWTFECWWYPRTLANYQSPFNVGWAGGTAASGRQVTMQWENSKLYLFGYPSGNFSSAVYHDATADQLTNKWNHLAAVFNGTSTDLYLNGKASGRADSSGTNWGRNVSESPKLAKILRNAATHYSDCFISDARIVKGTAVYSGEFTPPTGPLTTTGGTYSSTTNVNTSITSGHTKLLLKGTDAHVIDKSQNTNLTLVADAAAVTDAPNNSYISSTNALSLDGTGDYVTATGIPIGAGDFTLEAWVRTSSFANYRTIFTNRGTANASTNFVLGVNSSAQVYLYSSSFLITSSSTLSANTWHHVALVRNGTGTGSTVLYIDGSSVGSANVSNNFSDTAYDIGGDTVDSNHWNGYIQDLRVSVGKARYTSNFTVPSAPLKG